MPLFECGVFALDVYSVESLYYCFDSLDAASRWQAQSLARDPDTMRDAALQAALDALGERWPCRKDVCQAVRTSRQGPDDFAGPRLEGH